MKKEPRRVLTKEEKKLIYKYLSEKKKLIHIARVLNCSETAIYHYKKKYYKMKTEEVMKRIKRDDNNKNV